MLGQEINHKKIRKYFKLDDKNIQHVKILLVATKAVLRGEYIALNN